jgi:hypothetical protein
VRALVRRTRVDEGLSLARVFWAVSEGNGPLKA